MWESGKEIRICFLGESFVNGTGDPEFLGWTGRICANTQQKGYEITHYLDVFSILVNSPIWLKEAKANDGAHPRAAGYAEFANIVQGWEGWLNWFRNNDQ